LDPIAVAVVEIFIVFTAVVTAIGLKILNQRDKNRYILFRCFIALAKPIQKFALMDVSTDPKL